jgi:hypothetical protein
MDENTDVPEDEEEGEGKASKGKEEEPVPRKSCVCGTALTFRQRLELFEEAKKLEKKKEAMAKRAAKKAATATPEQAMAEAEPKNKKGGNRRNKDPYASLCSLCRRKALAGASVDVDEGRLREMHSIHFPKQARALAEQRRQGRNR